MQRMRYDLSSLLVGIIHTRYMAGVGSKVCKHTTYRLYRHSIALI